MIDFWITGTISQDLYQARQSIVDLFNSVYTGQVELDKLERPFWEYPPQ